MNSTLISHGFDLIGKPSATRTSLQPKHIGMRVSPLPHGISSAHLVSYLNPIPKLTYGRRKLRKRDWQRLNTPLATLQRLVPLPTALLIGVLIHAVLIRLESEPRPAEGGDKRAQKRLQSNDRRGMTALDQRAEMDAMKEDHGFKGGKADSCVVM